MSRMWFSMIVVAAVWAGMPQATYAQNTVTIFGSGSGAFETPGVATAGVATATCTLNSTTVEMACTARVYNIVDLTNGHIHVGGPGTSGPTVLNIPGMPLRSSDDFTLSWTWKESDLTLRPAQGVLKMADVFESCASGNCYINFHSTLNPGGEVRINMCPQGEDNRYANRFYQINVCTPGR
ncbi:MAG: CHRD domain-containing protein [Acidobacteria bacterium]|nr:CHRD domain-containing protein [Acidobacteriota bacterium]